MKSLYLILSILVCLSFVFAAEKAPAAPKAKTVSGTLEAVDTTASSIQVKTKTGVDTISLAQTTKIQKAGKKVTLADLKTGEKVTVTSVEGTVTKVVVQAGKKKAAAK